MWRTYDPTRFRVGRRFGGSQRSEHGERGGQVFERVRFGTAAGHVEQLPQQQHGGVRLAGTADPLKHRQPTEWSEIIEVHTNGKPQNTTRDRNGNRNHVPKHKM